MKTCFVAVILLGCTVLLECVSYAGTVRRLTGYHNGVLTGTEEIPHGGASTVAMPSEQGYQKRPISVSKGWERGDYWHTSFWNESPVCLRHSQLESSPSCIIIEFDWQS